MEPWLKESMVNAAGEAERRRLDQPQGWVLGFPLGDIEIPIDENSPPPWPSTRWMGDLVAPPLVVAAALVLLQIGIPLGWRFAKTSTQRTRIAAALSFGWLGIAALFSWIFAEHLSRNDPEKVASLLLLPPLIGWTTLWLIEKAKRQGD